MVSVTIKPRAGKQSKKFPCTIKLETSKPTVAELKRAIARQTKLDFYRQRLTTDDKQVLEDDSKELSEYGVQHNASLEIKDLGPQISWKTVFLIEYAGPIFIHPAFYYAQKLFYRKTFEHSRMQQVAMALVVAHFVKRELETLFVHKFSSATMPMFNVYKNSAHYWGLSGLLIAAPLYGPWNGAKALGTSVRNQDNWIYGWAALWLYGEVSNFITHLNLSSLRPAGTRQRNIPRGYGFNLVSCANYFFETVSWAAFFGLTLDPGTLVFIVAAVGQMYVWAVKKHKRYRKEFGSDYPRNRKAMFPFIA
ncbi:3-oxo-5a-steroid 4- dehydrogenase [Microbotryomycetes sp. JL201]|nr:3-oxo-5a-steroid 4- dehydrogenase [Microbotryomycetes sp. JL201]KAK4049204.1 3-oxo-5a-steroid 4- dehydrogenase [Microbotryomycetes sp. JL201]